MLGLLLRNKKRDIAQYLHKYAIGLKKEFFLNWIAGKDHNGSTNPRQITPSRLSCTKIQVFENHLLEEVNF